jgi:hypothetical protein
MFRRWGQMTATGVPCRPRSRKSFSGCEIENRDSIGPTADGCRLRWSGCGLKGVEANRATSLVGLQAIGRLAESRNALGAANENRARCQRSLAICHSRGGPPRWQVQLNANDSRILQPSGCTGTSFALPAGWMAVFRTLRICRLMSGTDGQTETFLPILQLRRHRCYR